MLVWDSLGEYGYAHSGDGRRRHRRLLRRAAGTLGQRGDLDCPRTAPGGDPRQWPDGARTAGGVQLAGGGHRRSYGCRTGGAGAAHGKDLPERRSGTFPAAHGERGYHHPGAAERRRGPRRAGAGGGLGGGAAGRGLHRGPDRVSRSDPAAERDHANRVRRGRRAADAQGRTHP